MRDIIEVEYVTVWDGGHEIVTNAKYDVQSKVVVYIESAEGVDEDGDEVEVLDEEYILLPTGEKFRVMEVDGEYKTFPPILHFEGNKNDIESFCNKLNHSTLRNGEIEMYASHPNGIKVATLDDADYETIQEIAKPYSLVLR